MEDAIHRAITLLFVEQRALQACDEAQLRFTVVNETHDVVPFAQAAFFDFTDGRFRLSCASGLASVAENSPYALWLAHMSAKFTAQDVQRLSRMEDAGAEDASWTEWLPDELLVLPVKDRSGRVLATVLYARNEPWTDDDIRLLARLHLTYGHCLGAFLAVREPLLARMRSKLRGAGTRFALTGALAAALFIPVRLSVLAPAEVIALNAQGVSAPQEGVINSFAVPPNSRVKAGDLLFSLDNSVQKNRREIAHKALEVARAEARNAQQRAFDEIQGKAELAQTMGRVREKEAELAATEYLASRVEVRADKDGIAVFADPNDWIGRPVQAGERIMQLAQPEDAGVLVWLAVADAINLERGAGIQLFLHTEPLHPRAGQVVEASYQATLSPSEVASYRLRARLEPGEAPPRIGLRGTVRVSGEWVALGYYLFRRPIAAVREWSGL